MKISERVALLAQIELKRRFSASRTWIALCLFAAVLMLGAWHYWHALPPRPQDDRLFGYAYLIAALVALHFGFGYDHRSRFDSVLAINFVSAAETYLAKIVAAVLGVCFASITTFVVALICSFGDIEYSAWYALLFCLITFLFLPLIALAEVLIDVEYPIAIVAPVFVAWILILGRSGDAKRALHLLGLDLSRFDYSGLSGLALRAIGALLLTAAIYPLYVWRIDPRKRQTLQA